jgi:hypothetical protein
MKTTQRNLFESDLTDVMSRDAAMERGMLLEVDAKTWVRIDRRGVVELHKSVMPEGVTTREVHVSSLPLLPLDVKTLRNEYFLEVLYGTRSGGVRLDTVLLDAVTRPEQHLRTMQELAMRGFILDDDTWQDLAKTLRAVMRARYADGSLISKAMSPMHWESQHEFLVARKRAIRVIQGGLSNHAPSPPNQTDVPALRPV